MSVGVIITLVVITVCAVVVLVAVSKIMNLVRTVKPYVDALQDGLEQQEIEIEETPKSISAMTSIYLPKIQADFPEFNYYEFKTKAENMLISAFDAITSSNLDELVNASADLKYQVKSIIDANLDARVSETYKDIKIHQTEIKNYVKSNGTCIITLQSSVGFHHYKKSLSGEIIEGSDTHMKQSRFNTELIYIQDAERVAVGDKAVSLTCPNCGAPIKDLGTKICPYCGSGMSEVNIRVWSINKFSEV